MSGIEPAEINYWMQQLASGLLVPVAIHRQRNIDLRKAWKYVGKLGLDRETFSKYFNRLTHNKHRKASLNLKDYEQAADLLREEIKIAEDERLHIDLLEHLQTEDIDLFQSLISIVPLIGTADFNAAHPAIKAAKARMVAAKAVDKNTFLKLLQRSWGVDAPLLEARTVYGRAMDQVREFNLTLDTAIALQSKPEGPSYG